MLGRLLMGTLRCETTEWGAQLWWGAHFVGGSSKLGGLNRFAIGGLGFAGGLFGFVIMIDFIKFDSLWF